MAHVTVGFCSMVNAVMLSGVLADGRSLFLLDRSAPFEASVPDLRVTIGLHYALGVYYDSNGYTWTDDRNFLAVMGCSAHQRRFDVVKATAFAAAFLCGAAAFVSLFGAAKLHRAYGFISLAVNTLAAVLLIAAVATGWTLYAAQFPCNGREVRLKDTFLLNYGLFFLSGALLVALLSVLLLVTTRGSWNRARPTTYPVDSKTSI